MVETVIKYIADDGKEFDEKEDAVAYENEQKRIVRKSYDKYMRTHAGRSLMSKNNLTDEGIWIVAGEDPNCDMAGHHHNPFIGRVNGVLLDVIEWAVIQPSFWQWGGGGVISRMEEEDEIKIIDLRKKDG